MRKTNLSTIDLLGLLERDGWAGRRVAGTNGGEYSGPCPFCGGRDRFNAWPNHPDGKGKWWCRGCELGGDAADYIQCRDKVGFGEALERLGLKESAGQRRASHQPARPAAVAPVTPRSPDRAGPPCPNWQENAKEFVGWAIYNLWTEAGRDALEYLRSRGLADDTIKAAELGYNPHRINRALSAWGLEGDGDFALLPGIVIPWWLDGTLWAVRIRLEPTYRDRARRRGRDAPKYWNVRGSRGTALYNADDLTPGWPAAIVEGEIDALVIGQEAGDLLAPVATGGTSGGRGLRWTARLALASKVLVAYDADMEGEKAAGYWLERLENAQRRRPLWGDATDMHQAGADVRSWIAAGLYPPEVAEHLRGDPWAEYYERLAGGDPGPAEGGEPAFYDVRAAVAQLGR